MTAACANEAAGDPGVAVRIYRPSPALQPYVTFFYFVEVTGALTDFLYPELGNIRFSLSGSWDVQMPRRPAPTPPGAALFGPTDRHSRVVTDDGCTFGFGITPIGWNRLIGEPAWLLANRVRPLRDELGIDATVLRDEFAASDDAGTVARIEQVLHDRLAAAPPVDPLVLATDCALRTRPATVGDFAKALGVSGPRLRRLCLNTFGFPSKRMIRMQRFLAVLGQVRSAVGGHVDNAIAPDYFDESHFYRDFRDFMAMSARDYFRSPRPLMAEAAAAQMRAGVTLSFAMPPPPQE